MFGRATIRLGIGPHSSSISILSATVQARYGTVKASAMVAIFKHRFKSHFISQLATYCHNPYLSTSDSRFPRHCAHYKVDYYYYYLVVVGGRRGRGVVVIGGGGAAAVFLKKRFEAT